MSKPYELDVLFSRATVNVNVPSTNEEFDNALGESGAVLEEAIRQVVYRNTISNLYAGVAKKLIADGHKPAQATKNGVPQVRILADKSEKPVLENDRDFIDRVTTGWETATLTELFDSVAKDLAFYTPGSRDGSSAKVPAKFLDSANTLIAKGEDAVAATVSKIESSAGIKIAAESDGTYAVESLARGIQAYSKWYERQAKADLGL